MKQKSKLIITGAFLLPLFTLFAACSPVSKAPSSDVPASPDAEARIEQARNVLKTASLKITSEEKEGKIIVDISIDNPEEKPITSAQVWLAFNPSDLKGESVDTAASAFELSAPYTADFDPVSGLVTIGRSAPTPITQTSIPFARVVFEKSGEGTTMLDAYDYRADLSGHTSVNVMLEGMPYNILKKPDSPVLIIHN